MPGLDDLIAQFFGGGQTAGTGATGVNAGAPQSTFGQRFDQAAAGVPLGQDTTFGQRFDAFSQGGVAAVQQRQTQTNLNHLRAELLQGEVIEARKQRLRQQQFEGIRQPLQQKISTTLKDFQNFQKQSAIRDGRDPNTLPPPDAQGLMQFAEQAGVPLSTIERAALVEDPRMLTFQMGLGIMTPEDTARVRAQQAAQSHAAQLRQALAIQERQAGQQLLQGLLGGGPPPQSSGQAPALGGQPSGAGVPQSLLQGLRPASTPPASAPIIGGTQPPQLRMTEAADRPATQQFLQRIGDRPAPAPTSIPLAEPGDSPQTIARLRGEPGVSPSPTTPLEPLLDRTRPPAPEPLPPPLSIPAPLPKDATANVKIGGVSVRTNLQQTQVNRLLAAGEQRGQSRTQTLRQLANAGFDVTAQRRQEYGRVFADSTARAALKSRGLSGLALDQAAARFAFQQTGVVPTGQREQQLLFPTAADRERASSERFVDLLNEQVSSGQGIDLSRAQAQLKADGLGVGDPTLVAEALDQPFRATMFAELQEIRQTEPDLADPERVAYNRTVSAFNGVGVPQDLSKRFGEPESIAKQKERLALGEPTQTKAERAAAIRQFEADRRRDKALGVAADTTAREEATALAEAKPALRAVDEIVLNLKQFTEAVDTFGISTEAAFAANRYVGGLSAFAPQLARFLGNRGALTKEEQDNPKELFPTRMELLFFREEADRKLERLERLGSGALGQPITFPRLSTNAPALPERQTLSADEQAILDELDRQLKGP